MKYDGKGILLILTATLCFAAIPAMVITAHAGGMDVLTLLSIRYLLASVILVPWALFRVKRNLPPIRVMGNIMLVAGIFLALEAGLYFTSLTLLPSSVAVLLLFTFPLMVNILGLFSGHRISPRGWLSVLLCLIGLTALLGPGLGQLNLPGIVFALLAAVSYSIYMVRIDKLAADVNPVVTNALVSLANALTMTVAAVATGTLRLAFAPSAWIAIFLMVAVSNVMGFLLFFHALKRLGPERTAMLNLTEPLFTVLIALLFLQEKFSMVQAAGAMVMVLGLFLFMRFSQKLAVQPED